MPIRIRTGLLLVAALALCVAGRAHATFMTFDFEYEFVSGNRLAGVLRGDLQPDGDTVADVEVISISYSGDPTLGFPLRLTPNLDTVSLSGAILQLVSFPPTATLGGYLFDDGPDAGSFGVAVFGPRQVFIEGDFLNTANWSLVATVPAPVAEPATVVLLVMTLAALAKALRTRACRPRRP